MDAVFGSIRDIEASFVAYVRYRGGTRQYWTYLRQTARGAVAHQREESDRFWLADRLSPHHCFDGTGVAGRLVDVSDVERKLVIEKIPILGR